MKILALDLSTKPGYAVLDEVGNVINLITHGTNFNLKEALNDSGLPQDFRFLKNADEVANFVKELVTRFGPDQIWAEQTNAGSFRSAQKQLEFIHCRLLQALKELGAERKLHYVNTSDWRRTCGIRLTKEQKLHNKAVKRKTTTGRIPKFLGKITNKHLAVMWANEKFGLKLLWKDEDAAEAACMAWCALQSIEITNKITDKILDKALS